MFRPRVIPVLLLKGMGLVKTCKFSKPTYIGDPMNAVKIFNDLHADELIFLDITATSENRIPSIDLIRKIGEEAFMPVAVGGGINKADGIKKLIRAGVEKVVINTAAYFDPNLVREASDLAGSQSVIVSIDARKKLFGKYEMYVRGGSESTGRNPADFAQEMAAKGAGEIMINSIDRDGMMQGYDIDLISSVADSVDIPVIACGGAGEAAHFQNAVKNAGASAVAAGSMFVYHGPRKGVLINYPGREDLQKLFQS